MSLNYNVIIERLKVMKNSKNVEGMARFGISPKNTLGISVADIRAMAKQIGKDHLLAQNLWSSGIHEARILASIIDDPKLVSEEQMDGWVKDIDSWDICDQCCGNLFDRTKFAYKKAAEWSESDKEFVKRAGFSLIAYLAVHDKKSSDEEFVKFLSAIQAAVNDERNFVKKAVNWSLRQIGKRNIQLNRLAIETVKEIQKMDSKSAKWIASDALRELTGKAVQKRLRIKASK
ncbi:MAG: DNA alkylation repair protein [Thaumarchaeota archaeon]|nr:DNA alkylation repair protein [Nitrososphaerota archaeon]